MKTLPLALALLALAACSKPQPAVNNEADVATLSKGGSAAIPTVTVANGTMVPGIWHFRESVAGDAAVYGERGKYPVLAIRCEPEARSIAFVRDGLVRAGAGTMLRIVTNGQTASYPALQANENRPVAIARATSSDGFLHGALSTSKELITVTLGDGKPLTLPADPAIAKVIASCPN